MATHADILKQLESDQAIKNAQERLKQPMDDLKKGMDALLLDPIKDGLKSVANLTTDVVNQTDESHAQDLKGNPTAGGDKTPVPVMENNSEQKDQKQEGMEEKIEQVAKLAMLAA